MGPVPLDKFVDDTGSGAFDDISVGGPSFDAAKSPGWFTLMHLGAKGNDYVQDQKAWLFKTGYSQPYGEQENKPALVAAEAWQKVWGKDDVAADRQWGLLRQWQTLTMYPWGTFSRSRTLQ